MAEAICPICLNTLGSELISQGVCSHPLHTECLVQWLMRDPNLSCPVCRATFQSAAPKDTNSDNHSLDGNHSQQSTQQSVDVLEDDHRNEVVQAIDRASDPQSQSQLDSKRVDDIQVVQPSTDTIGQSSSQPPPPHLEIPTPADSQPSTSELTG